MAVRAQLRKRSQATDWSFLSRMDFWFETMWLGALATVTLMFSFRSWTPTFDELKSYSLHFFALATLTLMAWDVAQSFAAARRRGEKVESLDVLVWLRRDRVHWLFAAVGAFAFVYVFSTVLSPMPYFSFWGLTPASSGYNLYTFLSMMVIFFGIATRMRSVEQLWRMIYLIAGIGTLTSAYGLAQHYGWEGIGHLADSDRIFATFGNPINFGAYLVVSVPATLVMAGSPHIGRRKWALALVAAAVGLQFVALWYTGSRGPFLGLLASIAVTGVLFVSLQPLRQVVRTASVVTMAAVFALLFVLPLGTIIDTGSNGSANPGSSTGGTQIGIEPNRTIQFGGELSSLVDRNGSGVVQAGLGGRNQIWAEVLKLAAGWDRVPADTGISAVLRPVFGFGPDMFRFSAPLASGPKGDLSIVDHAHNLLLQILMEQGYAGLITFVVVVAVATWLIFNTWLALRRRREQGVVLSLSFAAVSGALVGMAAEQMVGVARIEGLLTMWVLMALVAVIYQMASREEPATATGQQIAAAPVRNERRARGRRSTQPAEGQVATAAAFTIGVVVMVAAIAVFMLVDVQMFRAGRLMMQGYTSTEANQAYGYFTSAEDTAPEVESFTLFATDQLRSDARKLMNLDRPEDAFPLAQEAYRQLLAYHARNPLAIGTRISLAETAAMLVELAGLDYAPEMVARYEDLAAQFPNEIGILAVTANAYVSAQQYEKGIEFADRAIALESVTRNAPRAWWSKAEALRKLNRYDEAMEAFQIAINREDPDGIFATLSHRSMATILEEEGDLDGAKEHRDAADAIEKGDSPASQ